LGGVEHSLCRIDRHVTDLTMILDNSVQAANY
jgi:hypothetical protein